MHESSSALLNACPACGGRMQDGHCPACGYAPASMDGIDCYAPELATGGAGYDPAHYRTLAGMEAGNFWFRARNKLILHALRSQKPALDSFLEIGCGTGFVLNAIHQAFPGARLVGSEVFVEGLAFARQRLADVDLVQMDARRIPAHDSFDAIGAFDVIEHIDDDRGVLAQVARSLRPGGAFLATVPQHPWLWSRQDDFACHVRRYTRRELIGKVREAGLQPTFVSSFVSALLPVLLLSRMAGGKGQADDDPFRELRIPGWLNGLLGAMMEVDIMAIRAGLSLPAGGSLLLVARKPA